MATTTNYSWTTPDDTDLVKDGAAAIRTLGSSADTTVKDLNPGTTAGDIDYYTSSTAKARIGIGTAGQVLQVNAGATAPEWAAPAGGGKVLQVVEGNTSTSVSNSTTTYADTGLTATITPSSASSKVLVFVNHNGVYMTQPSAGSNSSRIKLFRGATEISKADYSYGTTQDFGGASQSILDTPATTSATTYKTQFISVENKASVTIQADNINRSSIILMEIGA
jgi:hypothetical protein